MRQLDHHGGTVLVAGIGQVLHPRHHLIAVGKDVVEHGRAVPRYGRRPGRHGQRDACLGPLDMVGAVAFLGHAVFGVRRFVCRDHHAIFESQMFELEGLQQGIVLA